MSDFSPLTPEEERCVRRLMGVHRKLAQLRIRRLEAHATIRLTDVIYSTIDHANPHRALLLARLSQERRNSYRLLAHIDGLIRVFKAIEESTLRAAGLRRLP